MRHSCVASSGCCSTNRGRCAVCAPQSNLASLLVQVPQPCTVEQRTHSARSRGSACAGAREQDTQPPPAARTWGAGRACIEKLKVMNSTIGRRPV
eukprot:6208869-Pleurochrysis_carterae.AAC.4